MSHAKRTNLKANPASPSRRRFMQVGLGGSVAALAAPALLRAANPNGKLNIAIIGADQEAVELFEHLIAAPGNHRATMILPGSALRVEDGTPL